MQSVRTGDAEKIPQPQLKRGQKVCIYTSLLTHLSYHIIGSDVYSVWTSQTYGSPPTLRKTRNGTSLVRSRKLQKLQTLQNRAPAPVAYRYNYSFLDSSLCYENLPLERVSLRTVRLTRQCPDFCVFLLLDHDVTSITSYHLIVP